MTNQDQPKKTRSKLIGRILLLIGLGIGGYFAYKYGWQANFRPVVEGEVYRSGQPRSDQLRRWTKEYGIQTVLNLRGFAKHHTPEEIETAEALGLDLISIYDISAHTLPPAPRLEEIISTIETAQRPMLIHCYHGNDRSGVASVIAAMAVGGQTYDQAVRQAHTLHFPWQKTEVQIQDILDLYEAYCSRENIGTGGWEQFKRWALEQYHPHFYWVEISAPKKLELAPGQQQELTVSITNRSDEAIPAGTGPRRFGLISYTGQETYHKKKCTLLGEPTFLPAVDIAPGDTVEVNHSIVAPTTPGRHTVYFDLTEEDWTNFARQGSDVHLCDLTVITPPQREQPVAKP